MVAGIVKRFAVTGKRTALIALLLAVAAAALILAGTTPPAAPEPYCSDCNVILVSIDTLRADHVGAYGYSRNTTPNIDFLASRGTLVKNAFSTSGWTVPAHTSMMSGLYPSEHGYDNPIDFTLMDNKTTLAKELKAAGYATGAVAGGWFNFPFFGPIDDFDYYSQGKYANVSYYLDRAERFIEKNKDEKFFLFLHAYDPHYPYAAEEEYQGLFTERVLPVSEFDGRYCPTVYENASDSKYRNITDYAISQYDSEIFVADEALGKIIGKTRELGVYDKTLFIVVSDHGEEFFEHGMCGHWQIYYEIVHVPTVYSGPNVPQTVVNGTVSHIDIMPTVLTYLGLKVPPQAVGVSVFSNPSPERQVFIERESSSGISRYALASTLNQSTIALDTRKDNATLESFFNLSADPYEKHNLAGTMGQEQELAIILAVLEWKWEFESRATRASRQAFEEVQEQLRELGYLN